VYQRGARRGGRAGYESCVLGKSIRLIMARPTMTTVLLLTCATAAVRADAPAADQLSLEAVKAMMARQEERTAAQMAQQEERMAERMAQLQKELAEKDAAIATLTAALGSRPPERRQVQLAAGGDVVELSSSAEVKALEKRVEACESKLEVHDSKLEVHDGKIHATAGYVHDMNNKLLKRPRAGSPAAPASPRTQPPLPQSRAVATQERRRLSSSPNGSTPINIRISGHESTLSFNDRMDGLTPFIFTGVGDGKLTCSGEVRAPDFATLDGRSLVAQLDEVIGKLEATRQFVGMVPPTSPPPSAPPASPSDPPPPPPAPPSAPPQGDCPVGYYYSHTGYWSNAFSEDATKIEMPTSEGGCDVECLGNYCATQCTGLCIAISLYTPSLHCYVYSSLGSITLRTGDLHLACIKLS